jgi:hypothetical protein
VDRALTVRDNYKSFTGIFHLKLRNLMILDNDLPETARIAAFVPELSPSDRQIRRKSPTKVRNDLLDVLGLGSVCCWSKKAEFIANL